MARKKNKKGVQLEEDEILQISKEEKEHVENVSRDAAIALSGSAIWKGAKSTKFDGEYDPCGLDEVLETVFGLEAKKVLEKKSDE